jgi:uncharacterized membrane protein
MNYFASFVLFLLVFSVVFELTAFDRALQKNLVKHNSARIDSAAENEQVLDFFSTGSLELNLTSDEMSHMQDVKKLNDYFKLFIWLLVVVFGVAVYFSMEGIKILEGLWLPLVIGVVLSMPCLFFPEQVFSLFHKVFFPQGNYLFGADSFLVSLYPKAYFFSLFYSILLRAFSAVIFLIIVSLSCKRMFRK